MAGCSHNSTAHTYTHLTTDWFTGSVKSGSVVACHKLYNNIEKRGNDYVLQIHSNVALSVSSLYSGLLSSSFQGRNDACPPQDLFLEGLGKKTSLLSQTITFISSQGAYCSYSLYTISLLGWHLCCLLWPWAMSCHSFWLCYLRGTEHYLSRGSAVQYLSRPPVLNQTLCYCKDLSDTFVIQDHCITASVFHKRQTLLMLR